MSTAHVSMADWPLEIRGQMQKIRTKNQGNSQLYETEACVRLYLPVPFLFCIFPVL